MYKRNLNFQTYFQKSVLLRVNWTETGQTRLLSTQGIKLFTGKLASVLKFQNVNCHCLTGSDKIEVGTEEKYDIS